MYKLSLAHLYPKLLNAYGDIGNVIAIRKRCEWHGIELDITSLDIGDVIEPSRFDMYFMGGGQDLQQTIVAKELQLQKNAFYDAVAQDSVFLTVCGGYQLFGKYYETKVGERIEGLGLLDAYTIEGEKRFVGNVTAECDFVKPVKLVGFENHGGLTYLEEGTIPLAQVLIGKGNNGEDKTEGARKGNIFGTYLHGAFLPKNPQFADYIIELALEKKYKEKIELASIDDGIEYLAHDSLVGKKY